VRTLRLLGIGWLFHFKMIMRSAFDGVGQVIYPLFFATVAFFVFRAGDSPRTLLYASLGAAVMGMWSATSTTAGSAMQRERWQGTLEALVATPTNFALILLPVTIAMATIGIYSLVATLFPGIFPDSFRSDGQVAVYFEAAGIITTLILLGQVLELRARSRTSSAIRALLGLAPKTARHGHRLACDH